jgi:PAS domain S-box-containing protein
VFTSERISVLELLASQAAISLENARLYSDLGEREARIRHLVDSNIIGIVIGDVQGRIIEANQAFLDIVGYAREDLVSGRLRWTELTPAEWRDADDQALAQLKAAGTVQPREKEYFRKDGSRVPVLVGATTFGDRQDQGVAFVLDLTERKRADYLTRQVFERSPDRISIVGRDYRYQRVNSAFERRWGMPAETIVGMHVADLLGMEAFEQMAKAYLDRCFAGEEVSYADWLTTPLGRRYSAVTYSPLRPESERVEATLVIIRDLTEHVLASEALREAQAELAHVTRVTMLGELTASIAHEVNQPLATVVTFGDACLRWLDREVPRIDKARSAVEQMIGSARHASDVIERIRALSKRRPFESVRLDINQVIDDVVVLIRREINLHSISLRLDLGASLPPVDGDRIQLQQVITNLLMNGIQAMSAVTDRDRELRIRSRVHGSDQMLITVEDSGIGIGPEHARLFNAFFTTKPDGMGMGLSICRSIIEAHDGRLWAKANVPHGATFLFTLPLNADSVS